MVVSVATGLRLRVAEGATIFPLKIIHGFLATRYYMGCGVGNISSNKRTLKDEEDKELKIKKTLSTLRKCGCKY